MTVGASAAGAPTARAADVMQLGGGFHPLTPARLLDTRPGEATIDDQYAGIGVRDAGTTLELPVLAVVAFPPTPPPYRSTSPSPAPAPQVSSPSAHAEDRPRRLQPQLRARTNRPQRRHHQSRRPTATVCLYTLAPTHLIVDVNGSFATGSGFDTADRRLASWTPAPVNTPSTANSPGNGNAPPDPTTRTHLAGRGGIPADATAVAQRHRHRPHGPRLRHRLPLRRHEPTRLQPQLRPRTNRPQRRHHQNRHQRQRSASTPSPPPTSSSTSTALRARISLRNAISGPNPRHPPR